MKTKVEIEWCRFVPIPHAERIVTKLWAVNTTYDPPIRLGEVRWYSPWRKYAFTPSAATVFEESCLRNIAAFCEAETAKRKAEREAVA